MALTRRVFLFAMTAAAASSAPALAHGPTRQKVTETIEINAPADKVWAAIANFDDMSWHPAIEKTDGVAGNAVGSKRVLTLKGGGTIEEELAKYEPEKMSLMYRITSVDVKVLPVTNYSAWLSVKANGNKSLVEWRGAFYRGYPNNDPPPELSDEAAVNAITAVYKAGLEALKKKLEGGA